MTYRTRDEEIRATISRNEAIRLIEEVYHARYALEMEPSFDAFDQLLACEAMAKATPIKEEDYQKNERTNESASVNGMVNDIGKLKVNFELTQRKQELINKLKTFNYRTPPILIAPVLEEFFKEWPSLLTHWPYMARTYTPKTIKSVLNFIINRHSSGYPVENPPGLFTLVIQKRPKRKNKYGYQ